MRILYHPDFPNDIRKFEAEYKKISDGLATRFRAEVQQAIDAIKASPQSAGHFLQTGSGSGATVSAKKSQSVSILRSLWIGRGPNLRFFNSES